MDSTKSRRSKRGDGVLSSLSGAIERLTLSKETSGVTSADAAFGASSNLLTTIRDSGNEQEYAELGLTCANVCHVLDRGLKERQSDEISQSVLEAIQRLTSSVTEMEKRVAKRGKQSTASRLLHPKSDKDRIAAWGQTLNGILQIFNTELLMNMALSDHQRKAGEGCKLEASAPLGELPPPPPRACFGREELIEKIIGLAENLTPIALIGAGGIGKTSIALTVLHHPRIEERFRNNRRFIRCDQFPASRANFLSKLSKVVGANVDNPESLVPLRPSLSSKEMLIVLDNAESILDSQGVNGREIYEVVEELSQFNKIWLCITSRITTVPTDCEHLDVPTLSAEAARCAFIRICNKKGRPDLVNNILGQLDFHPLSITLLATVARQNGWDNSRLAREWEQGQTRILQTDHNKSLAAAVELSLASPMFQGLGPDARELLGIVAFFPQGVSEKNLDWLFPTISNKTAIFDKFCNLSLTYRSKGFFTMLAPLRDYLTPRAPMLSPLLCATRDRYFTRVSIIPGPSWPGFEESRWVVSEDVNAEHLLNVFMSICPDSVDFWLACEGFMEHLYWHKPRHTILEPKIEGLSDDHPLKPGCLHSLSRLFKSVGNYVDEERLLAHALKLWREQGDETSVARTLLDLCNANRMLHRFKEGIEYAREALEIYQRLGDTINQGICSNNLAYVLYDDKQIDAAEATASRAINLLLEKGEEFEVCKSHRILGDIYHSKGEKEKAIRHFEAALGVASQFNWFHQQFWINYSLAELFRDEGEFDKANAYAGQAKPQTGDDTYKIGRAIALQAEIWYRQGRLGEASSEALLAIETYEKLGDAQGVGICRRLLQRIKNAMENQSAPERAASDLSDVPPGSPA